MKSLEDRIDALENRVRILENRTPAPISGKDDPLLSKAIEIAVKNGKVSTSYIQRMLMIGYARSAALIDEMEEQGLIGPAKRSGQPREVLKK
ncbi:MAG: hypothetical protein NTV98_05870 [Candidatus Roizmanbacteria bacterium]|nr:hypothetical protein [Candidatus Roizmanbacteria bacterium]